MREIKFRAWDGKEMRPASPNMMLSSYGGSTFWQFAYDAPEPTGWDVMQFTGLKDCNGVEIYEGDIVETKGYPFYTEEGRNYLGEVAWFEEAACWHVFLHVVSDRVRGRASGDMLGAYIEERTDLEVAGNIHQNPELLATPTS